MREKIKTKFKNKTNIILAILSFFLILCIVSIIILSVSIYDFSKYKNGEIILSHVIIDGTNVQLLFTYSILSGELLNYSQQPEYKFLGSNSTEYTLSAYVNYHNLTYISHDIDFSNYLMAQVDGDSTFVRTLSTFSIIRFSVFLPSDCLNKYVKVHISNSFANISSTIYIPTIK